MGNYENVKTARKNLKEKMIYILGGKCCICGYDKCRSALEFHHINPEEKEFHLGENPNVGFEKAANEMRKCILVCANCHREIHAFNINVSNYNCFDEKKYLEKQQELELLRTHKIFRCKTCGIIISKGAEYCVSCGRIASRTCERPSREVLKKKIRTMSFVSIAEDYKVSDNAIRKWCDAYNLPKKKKDIESISDEEWEKL